MDAWLWCKKCKEWVRNISNRTEGLIINIKNLAESESSKCMTCGKVDDVILQITQKMIKIDETTRWEASSMESSTNDA